MSMSIIEKAEDSTLCFGQSIFKILSPFKKMSEEILRKVNGSVVNSLVTRKWARWHLHSVEAAFGSFPVMQCIHFTLQILLHLQK